MKYLINIYGPMAAGKSTLTDMLWNKLEGYAFVDRPMIKRGLRPIGVAKAKTISRNVSSYMLDELMKDPDVKGIIVAELNPNSIIKRHKNTMKENGYKFIPFRLVCSLDETINREISRQHTRNKEPRIEHLKKIYTEYDEPYDFEIVVDTEKLRIDKAFEYMLSKIK